MGLEVIGAEEESFNLVPAVQIWHLLDGDGVVDPSIPWSGVGVAAREAGQHEVINVAKNISFALTATSLRLRDISREYRRQHEFAIDNKMKPGNGFAWVHTLDLYLALHAFLTEACSARDHLAIFLSETVFKCGRLKMPGLIKKNGAKIPVGHTIRDDLLKITKADGDDGWMAWMGALRDLVVHEAPIHSLGGATKITANVIQVGPRQVYMMDFGIPRRGVRGDGTDLVDALTLCRMFALRLMKFALAVVQFSPLAPATVTVVGS
jgi:hypothetical protein